MEVNITFRKKFTEIRSLSGIESVEERFFIMGDNSPFLLELDKKYEFVRKHQLISSDENEIEKKSKPDFEAICKVKMSAGYRLFIFGSGSKSPQRDVLFIVDPKGEKENLFYSLENFYALLRTKLKVDVKSLNIEAAIYHENAIYLFDRNTNCIIKFDVDELFFHLDDETFIPEFKIYSIQLPQHENLQASFSGADCLDDKIIFTASLENTSNWYDDGEIKGSYIGLISIPNLKNNYKAPCKLITQNHVVQKIKIESVSILEMNREYIKVVMVTDNDGLDSEILEFVMK